VEDAERALMRRQLALDAEIRFLTAHSRLSFIGKDRNHDRYWFLDSFLGCAEPEQLTAAAQAELAAGRYSRHAHIKGSHVQVGTLLWATGALFVEESVPVKSEGNSSSNSSSMISMGGSEVEEGIATPSRWGYYIDVPQYELFKQWLDPRGVREAELLNTLNKMNESVEFSIRKRQEVSENVV
jgi:hypothetical protein